MRGEGMIKIIHYLFTAEDSCSVYQPEIENFNYEELKLVLRFVKTLFWVAIAIIVGIVIGNVQ